MLGHFQIAVLALVERGCGFAYGMQIARDLTEQRKKQIPQGNVVAVLRRLQNGGLVTSRMSDSRPVPGGRAKRIYETTQDGKRALLRAREDYEKVFNDM